MLALLPIGEGHAGALPPRIRDAPGTWRTTHFAGTRISHSTDGGRRWEILRNGLPDRLQASITLITSLFLHGGIVHLFGNMIYLWVFGGPMEDALGHVRYFFFFIVCGVVGSLVHTAFFPASPIPSIGASGSIAGVLGAFLVLRPRARIVTLFPLVVYWAMAEVRALVFLPIWFAMQFFNGFLSLAAASGAQQAVGVAWWAHIGGFLFGACAGLSIPILKRDSTRDTT